MNCRFCAQSRHYATGCDDFPLMSEKNLLDETLPLWERGIARVGWVAAGCVVDNDELDRIAATAETISTTMAGTGKTDAVHGASFCASLGQLNESGMRRLKSAGVRRYHHNLETSECFYPRLCTTQRWGDRRATVERARDAGFEICCGGLFGVGETWRDRHDFALVLQDIGVDCVPINFLSPIPGTPLGGRQRLPVEEALRIIAMFRILLPRVSLRICGGRPSTLGSRQDALFRAGADALMTGNYLTTSGVDLESDLAMLRRLRLSPSRPHPASAQYS